jgi:hypothetical protein
MHIYTQTIHRTTQNKQYIEQHKNKQYIEQHEKIRSLVRAVPHLCGFNPGICLTTEEKARENLSQGSRRVPAGTMKEICPVVSPLIHAERRTEGHDEANRRFSRLCEGTNDEKPEPRPRRFLVHRPVEGQRFVCAA